MAITYRAVKGSNLTPTEVDTNFSDLVAVDTLKAPLASPALTGVPTAPTAAADTSTTQIATTAFAKTEADAAQAVADAHIADATAAHAASAIANTPAGTIAATDVQAAINELDTSKAAYNAVQDETGTSFTLTAANHANRDTHAANAAAIAANWNTGHGMTKGDSFTIFQTGAGVVTVTQVGGTVTLAPNVDSASTAGDNSWLLCAYMGSDELLVADKGAVAGVASPLISVAGGPASAHTGTTATTEIGTIVLPGGAMGPRGRFDLTVSGDKTGTAGICTISAYLGGTMIWQTTAGLAAQFVGFTVTGRVMNNNSESAQMFERNNTGKGSSTTFTDTFVMDTAAVDTSTDQTISIRVALGSAADSVTIRRWHLEAIYAA